MKNKLFIASLLAINFLRGLFYPLWVEILPLFLPALKNRRDFERLNHLDPLSRSFRLDQKVGHILFHVSSEGELEQVRPLISYYLQQSYNLELVYTSESVEKKCQQLALEALGRIRLYRLPVLTFFFFNFGRAQSLQHWCTAKKVVLCRYDFFPELLLLGIRPACRFVLLNATLKGKDHLSSLMKWYYRNVYSLFHTIIAATQRDREEFCKLVGKQTIYEQFDFRIMQIDRRVQNAELTLKQKKLSGLIDFITQRFPASHRLVFGSAWPNEMQVFAHREFLAKVAMGEIFTLIAPHQLSNQALEAIKERIELVSKSVGISLPVYMIEKNSTEEDILQLVSEYQKNPGVVLSQIPGVLCELYHYFGHAFVGGGHGRSIHSVLEPFVAGAHIFCGPKTFRSTEFDLVCEFDPASIDVIDELELFYSTYLATSGHEYNRKEHRHFVDKSVGRFLAVIEKMRLG